MGTDEPGSSAELMLLITTSACAPLTFSKEAPIDFEKYDSVRVAVRSGNAEADTDYLANALRDGSGFTQVRTGTASANLLLDVTLTVRDVSSIDSNGDVDESWDGSASFVATSPAGEVVDRGTVDDTSETSSEVSEDVLDEIAFHYFPAFRL